jgi:hypothetical protein
VRLRDSVIQPPLARVVGSGGELARDAPQVAPDPVVRIVDLLRVAAKARGLRGRLVDALFDQTNDRARSRIVGQVRDEALEGRRVARVAFGVDGLRGGRGVGRLVDLAEGDSCFRRALRRSFPRVLSPRRR